MTTCHDKKFGRCKRGISDPNWCDYCKRIELKEMKKAHSSEGNVLDEVNYPIGVIDRSSFDGTVSTKKPGVMLDMKRVRAFDSKYPGKCHVCSERIEVGEKIADVVEFVSKGGRVNFTHSAHKRIFGHIGCITDAYNAVANPVCMVTLYPDQWLITGKGNIVSWVCEEPDMYRIAHCKFPPSSRLQNYIAWCMEAPPRKSNRPLADMVSSVIQTIDARSQNAGSSRVMTGEHRKQLLTACSKIGM